MAAGARCAGPRRRPRLPGGARPPPRRAPPSPSAPPPAADAQLGPRRRGPRAPGERGRRRPSPAAGCGRKSAGGGSALAPRLHLTRARGGPGGGRAGAALAPPSPRERRTLLSWGRVTIRGAAGPRARLPPHAAPVHRLLETPRRDPCGSPLFFPGRDRAARGGGEMREDRGQGRGQASSLLPAQPGVARALCEAREPGLTG